MIKRSLRRILLLLSLSYVFFMLGNGIISLTGPDEVFYVQTAKEMARHHTWLTPYLFDAPQFEKPVFLYWLLRSAFVFFGISSFSARFFPAFFAMIGVIAVYFLSLLGFKNEKKAFFISLVLMSGALYVGLARMVFTDMVFSVFISLSLLSFFWGYSAGENKGLGILLFFVFSALAVLTKGPLGILLPFPTVISFLALRKEFKYLFCRHSLWGIFIFIAVAAPWYLFMIDKYGSGFIREFFYNDHFRRLIEAEHSGNDKWYFYPLATVGCMFPWSLYTAASLVYLFIKLKKDTLTIHLFSACWIGIVFVIFQSMHSKLVSYIFPFFPALAVVSGDFIYEKIALKSYRRIFYAISLVTVVVLMLLPLLLFAFLLNHQSYLSSRMPVYAFCLLFSLFIFTILFFILRRTLLKAIYLFTFLIPALLLLVPFIHKEIEPYISSRDACEYLLRNYKVENAILCSKPFARGARYYTDKEVAIVNTYGKNFFSPHPILFLDDDAKVRDFLKKQSVTYCILRRSGIEDVKRAVADRGDFTLLKIIGNGYIVKIAYRP